MSSTRRFQAHGKWILCGEHTVVRGGPALVFPLLDQNLVITDTQPPAGSDHTSKDTMPPSAKHLLARITEEAARLLDTSLPTWQGLSIKNQIPLSAGLGASAALCLSFAKWLIHHKRLQPTQMITFAQELEHLFHQRSSGLDVAGCAYQHPLLFEQGQISVVQPKWSPLWYLADSQLRASTSACVQHVALSMINNPSLGKVLDQRMRDSVQLALDALTTQTCQTEGLEQLKHSIDLAQSCFDEWGLNPPQTRTFMADMKSHGAIATKMTGSGNGGYIITLWDQPPPITIQDRLIPLVAVQTECTLHQA